MRLALSTPTQLRTPIGAYQMAEGFPKFVWDFVSGYHSAGFSVQRASSASTQARDGSYAQAPAGAARFTSAGALLLEPASVNLADVPAAPLQTDGLYVTGAPEAYISAVEDTDALAAAGLLNVTAGRALLLDNSAGSSNARLALSTTVDSTGDWVLSAFLRSNGTVSLRTGYGGYPVIGSLVGDPVVRETEYVRASRSSAQKDGGAYNPMDPIWFDVSPGAKLWISGPQWEPNRLSPSSPIWQSAGQTSRAAETLLLPVRGPIGQIIATTPQGRLALTANLTPEGALIAPLDSPILQLAIT